MNGVSLEDLQPSKTVNQHIGKARTNDHGNRTRLFIFMGKLLGKITRTDLRVMIEPLVRRLKWSLRRHSQIDPVGVGVVDGVDLVDLEDELVALFQADPERPG